MPWTSWGVSDFRRDGLTGGGCPLDAVRSDIRASLLSFCCSYFFLQLSDHHSYIVSLQPF